MSSPVARLSLASLLMLLTACASSEPAPDAGGAGVADSGVPDGGGELDGGVEPPRECVLEEDGLGPAGTVPVVAELVAENLEVPWGLAWLPNGDLLVTERAGRVRRISGGALLPDPIATLPVSAVNEGGLLGIALSPNFANNRRMFLYVTVEDGGGRTNQVERWVLTEDFSTATRDAILLAGIPGATFHDGGRLRFGPDGQLYVGTGDAGDPSLSQDVESLAGKVLRIDEDGAASPGNPFGNRVWMLGLRNVQGFDWFRGEASRMAVTDHGPSGELGGRRFHDEVNVGGAGDNFGWPTLYRCDAAQGLLQPSLTFATAVPPGGAAFYTGTDIPEWTGSLLVGALGSTHLHRVQFEPGAPYNVASHEVYFDGTHGRLREVVMGPDGQLYVTTSNCDGRAVCPPTKDRILRIVRSN